MKSFVGFEMNRESKPLNELFIVAWMNRDFIDTFELKIYLYYELPLQSSFD
jgi:hypothetical protein